jgi:hypothetical protein
VKLAEHYVAIGQTDIYLYGEDLKAGARPWHLVASVTPGGTVRLGIPVSCSFHAPHECGLTFSWGMDIEDRGANGEEMFKVNSAALRVVMNFLPTEAKASFSKFLTDTATAIAAKADEFQTYADEQRSIATELEGIAGGATADA